MQVYSDDESEAPPWVGREPRQEAPGATNEVQAPETARTT